MLIYHPLTDVYHCINRNLILLNEFTGTTFENDRFSIYDYYLLFPQDLRKVSLPNDFRMYKKIKFQNKYNEVKNSQTVYKRLRDIQKISVNSLITHGLVNAKSYKEANLIVGNKTITDIDSDVLTETETEVVNLIKIYFNKISLRELKERTKLTEYRYEHS
ncbi:ABC-three component system middle component 5 [Olleya sp. Hel_I_94]|uniref:ABC-three component system middle component 5 n=1 Tax=Olleya sp. Hel_I_94 TaxID=1250001 RepID=UPI0011AA17FD|nr:ABC-three component system middle component 5 [Olleya sp. Hel_I_94]TVZ48649.1 hypothetical protein JM82_3299 [Olleya sp. Hel_I_94]